MAIFLFFLFFLFIFYFFYFTKYHQILNLSLGFDGFPLDFDGFLKNFMIFREVEKIKIQKKLRKKQNFQKKSPLETS